MTWLACGTAPAQQIPPQLYQGMRWRMIGPFRGGRVLAVSGISGQPNTYYFGAVAGGVWRTTNAGETWDPIFDQQPIASIGALAIAPSDPNVIYVGSGESDMRSDISFGNGVYKSTDGGQSWRHLGLRDTMQIARILVDPQDPQRVLLAALGHAYGPNAERGVFRSTDGGETWQKVLYKDENTGAIDLAFAPGNPRVIYAALWSARRTPWSQYPPNNGPGSGLYKSSDGGSNWVAVTGHGLPPGDWGRVGIAVARGKSVRRVYALIEAKEGGLFRSDDDGQNWQRVGTDRRIRDRSWYFSAITVDPENPDVVYLPNVALYRSVDGGRNFKAFKGAPGGDDYHDLWIDPQNPKRMILGCDQGAAITVDGGETWSSWNNQPTAQLYHVITDNQFPYYVYGAQQDSGTVATASRSDSGSITFRDWYSVGAGESGYLAPDPADPNIVFGGDTYGMLFRFDRRTGQSEDIGPSVGNSFELAMPEKKLRFSWTSPLVFSPQDPHVLYFGAQYVLKTSNGGRRWERISPDLTGRATEQPPAAPPTLANARRQGYGTVYTIAPSAVQPGVIWVGTDTGLVHLTRDEGKTWREVTPSGLAEWSRISLLDASRFDAGTAYLAADRHRLDDYRPYIYRTHDFGQTWQKVTEGIEAPAYVHAVREDPARKGLLYAATETGVYVSFDDGGHWQSLQLNLPVAPVHDLVVKDDDLVIATHGRSFWILDNLTPLRQARREISAAEAFLFEPQTAIRIRNYVSRDTPLPKETPAGENPPAGALIDYYLGSGSSAAQREVALSVLDTSGKLVRRFSSSDAIAVPERPPAFTEDWLHPQAPLAKTAGMHRFVWDLRYPSPPALYHEYSNAAAYGQTVPALPLGPLVAPGDYELRLEAGSRTYSRHLKLEMDPRVRIAPADLKQQHDLEMQIWQAMSRDYEAVLEARQLRSQIKESNAAGSPGELRAAGESLDQKIAGLLGVEDPPKAIGNSLSSLNRRLGDQMVVVDSADAPPTEQAQQAFQEILAMLESQLTAWAELKRQDVAAYNALAERSGARGLATGKSAK